MRTDNQYLVLTGGAFFKVEIIKHERHVLGKINETQEERSKLLLPQHIFHTGIYSAVYPATVT